MKRTFKELDKSKYKSVRHVITNTEKTSNRRSYCIDNYRGSQYKGVSVNGGKWQVFFIFKNKKYYKGQIEDELDAAKLYDAACILHYGLDAKTNFAYSQDEVRGVMQMFQDASK